MIQSNQISTLSLNKRKNYTKSQNIDFDNCAISNLNPLFGILWGRCLVRSLIEVSEELVEIF